jgi:dihydrofolate reductase
VPSWPSLTAIVAVAANGVIGDGRGLPWSLPEDFARFKRVTMGGVMIMGRRTYESLGGALRGRTSIVLTRQSDWVPGHTRGCEVFAVTTVAQVGALLGARPDQRWWSAGGGEIYRVLWPFTTQIDVSEVHAEPAGSVTFPRIDPAQWRQTSREQRPEFDFVTYERIGPVAADALKALIADAR